MSRLARRAVLRATRLGANHQQEVDQAIIEALRSVAAAGDGEHRHLTARLNALEVELASALRALAEVPRGRSRGAPAEGWRTMLLRLLEPGAPPLPLGSAREGVAEVETDVGSLLLPAHDRVVLPILAGSGTWEPDESALIDRKLGAGMTAVDLGAHVGYLTIRAARAVGATGRVIAVEPAPLNFALLNANLRRNGFANVLTIPAAAWRKSGTARLEVDPYNTGDHRVFQVDRRDAHVEVPALALDDLLPEELRIDFVKVDTQGADHAAIEGMARTVERWRPPMLVEFWPPGIRAIGEDPLAVADYYGSLGYAVEILERPDLGSSPPSGDVVEAAEANRGNFVTLWLEPRV
ncbi:MAG TPA: FkbM family methyltransferase [Actinomycetota bacterium]|nr:FkbM family methyltransferase [Actinomycetota bacterium]